MFQSKGESKAINSTEVNYYILLSIAWRKLFNHKAFLFFYYIWPFYNECLFKVNLLIRLLLFFSKLVIKDTDVFCRPVMSHSTNVAFVGFGLRGQSLMTWWSNPLLPTPISYHPENGSVPCMSFLPAMVWSTTVYPIICCTGSGRVFRTKIKIKNCFCTLCICGNSGRIWGDTQHTKATEVSIWIRDGLEVQTLRMSLNLNCTQRWVLRAITILWIRTFKKKKRKAVISLLSILLFFSLLPAFLSIVNGLLSHPASSLALQDSFREHCTSKTFQWDAGEYSEL